jgi:acetyl esterase/lipase
MRNGISLILAFWGLLHQQAIAQIKFNLYDGSIPNSKPHSIAEESMVNPQDGAFIIKGITVPTIEAYIPEKRKSNGTAVIIFPGGGYYVNAYRHEGTDVAKKLKHAGIAAFVVKYRIPDSACMLNPAIGPLQDAQRAIQWVRFNAAAYNINKNMVGVMGFSAGGHLAACSGTKYQTSLIDPITDISIRPDFMVLIYPVISFSNTYSLNASAKKLLGTNASDSIKVSYSPEKLVTPQTPPVFMVHAYDDEGVSTDNSIDLFKALKQNKVAAELHIYAAGGHGFGLTIPGVKESWLTRCLAWIKKVKKIS